MEKIYNWSNKCMVYHEETKTDDRPGCAREFGVYGANRIKCSQNLKSKN